MDSWQKLWSVLELLLPPVSFAIVSSLIIYGAFVALPARLRGRALIEPAAVDPENPAASSPVVSDFGLLLGPSYVFMTSCFGVALGILFTLIGGFHAAATGAAGTGDANLPASVASVLVAVLTVVGTLFIESGNIGLRKPTGAVAFLLSFVVTGLYWAALTHPTGL